MNSKKENINKDLQAILDILINFIDGASIQEIQQGFKTDIGRKTLLRRLKELIVQNKVHPFGQGRASKYMLVNHKEEITVGEPMESFLPLSNEGRKIQHFVTLPPQKRTPVGYNQDFLINYQPNVNSYLSKEEKEKLAKIGFTSQSGAPAGTYAKQILERLLIDLAWNSSRLEGNTYSLLDTKRLFDEGICADNKSESETQMIFNHKDAIEFMVQHSEEIDFNRYTILNLHALLSNNLLLNPAASGSLRAHSVGLQESVFTPLAMPQLIEEMFDLMLQKAGQIKDPFEQAFFIMVQLPYLQPFDNVNKRVSRLATNISLNKKNLAPLSFIEVPNKVYLYGLLGIYELNKVELLKDVFMWAYDRSAEQYAAQRQSLGAPDSFRLKYRNDIRKLIAEIIVKAMPKDIAIITIGDRSLQLPQQDQSKFVQTIETELISLHEGNFARYYVSPSQFANWQALWNAK